MRSFLAALALLAACGPDTTISKQKIDDDGDGYSVEVDCDDTHATVHPDAEEVCDGVDNDCDGGVDAGATDEAAWYADADGDGYGDAAAETLACEALTGTVADATDCDDAEAAAFPGNPEVCDEIDNDCNGAVDDDPTDLGTFYVDTDGDGYGDAATAVEACEAGPGEVADATDCDDGDAAIHPDAVEDDCADPIDYNCDGSTGYADADGDGSPACEDCDDGDAARSPDAVEVCDEADTDEDCDGASDDDDDATGATTWYRDLDGDGYATGGGVTIVQCEQPTGYTATTGDCDDYDNAANPGEAEVCDALDTDEDCDGLTDDADPSTDAASWNTWYADRDADAYGDAARTVSSCEAPANYVANDDDCDDTNAARNPGEAEVCDAADVDEDCDGLSDDADAGVTGGTTYYVDGDGDGYGGTTSVNACSAVSGYVTNDDDCNDASAAISPADTEVCDSANVDEDCDGLADDSDSSASGKSTWFRDADSDGYAGSGTTTSACDQPSGYLATATDCNDASAAVSPAATEVCDAADVDEDCDSLADDADASATGKTTWYRDADSDGYAGTLTTSACAQPAGYLPTSTDCNDSNAAVSPGDAELCDSANTDEDCDGLADDLDASATGETTWYRDADADTYGNAAVTTSTCDLPAGYVANDDDCDDTSSAIGSNRTWYRDADSDGYGLATSTSSSCTQPSGYVSDASDCNDASASVSPGDAEVCDGANVDEDCDGLADDADTSTTGRSTLYRDADSDGYGAAGTTTSACDTVTGYVTNDDDCNDASAAVSPADTEVCDAANVDEDCDGLADDADPSATGETTYYLDGDGDGYGTSSASVALCEAPSGYATVATDCDDAESDAHPGGTEVCGDEVDQDCSGADESCASTNYSGTYAVNTDYDAKIYGTSAGDYFAWTLATGDFNGDGEGDVVVSALDETYGGSSYAGVVYGYYSGPPSPGVSTAQTYDSFLYYNSSSTYDGSYGLVLSNIGDINTDGKDDLLVRASASGSTSLLYYGGDTGSYVYSTPDDNTFACHTGAAAGAFTATSGADDWICGLTSYTSSTGIAYVYPGTSTTATASLPGETSGDYAGTAVAGGGDVNGDGYDDIWVSAPYDDDTASDAGAAYLVYAPVTGTFNLAGADAKIRGGTASDLFGMTLAMPGDVDGDGYDDIAAAAIGQDSGGSNAGAIYLVTDPSTGTAASRAVATIVGEDATDAIGNYEPAFGDVDGDGEIDVLVGTPQNDDNGSNAGSVWLVYGPLSGTIALGSADAEWLGTSSGDALGVSAGILPDTDGDGRDELVMGGYYADERGYTNHGALWMWYGE